MTARTLERLNYRVLAAAGAHEASEAWRRHRGEIGLLLSDMVMADGESGLELARALRKDRPDLPVIIMSGYSEDLVGATLDPDMAFLAKPWTSESLGRAVALGLRSPTTRDESVK
mgnify:CR=1 FL=1